MSNAHFTLFDTAIGACAIAWSERGIVGLQLPESSGEKMRARFHHRFPETEEAAPPPAIERAIGLIQALLSGEAPDLSGIVVDLEGVPAFERRVYEIARGIPVGATLTYGEIAAQLGDKLLSRDVGQALGKNPFPVVVPCHRVVASDGKLGGFSAPGGMDTKRRILAIESRHAPALPLFAGG
jgi:methylated-DNA-[protein]-cysteine S-methyltransferase